MPDEYTQPQLPADQSPSWLAKNRKIVILGGLALFLGVAAVLTYVIPRGSKQPPLTINTAEQNTSQGASNTASTRPTFQRSTITNTTAPPPVKYQPPTQQELQQTIDRLKQNTKP